MINFIKKIRNDLQSRKTNISDITIVEFPKSGITFFSIFLSRYINSQSKYDFKINYSNINRFVHDIQMGYLPKLSPFQNTISGRLVKTHSEYSKYLSNVIYLVRKPEYCLRSYWKYLEAHNIHFDNFSEFIRSNKYGISAWNRHINSWVQASDNRQRFFLIQYEDLIHFDKIKLEDLCSFIGIEFDQYELKKTLKELSIKISIDEEMRYKRNNPRMKFQFSGSEYSEFDKDDIAYIYKNITPAMKKKYQCN